MGTFIHGIAASENIDSSGERLSIAGMDISSLEKDGVFNWEHKADQPGQVVGKILKAKKIFSEQDCEDDYQLDFFKKCGVPYLYVMGELMDDFKESAKEVAGQLRYDNARPNQENTTNFSIEGVNINKTGMDILKSIARKVTITVTPCNKAAKASIVPIEKKIKRNSVDELFKTEAIEIAVLAKDEGFGAISGPTSPSLAASEPMMKDQPKLTVAPPPSNSIGQTKTGQHVSATGKVHEYTSFSEQDHRDASNLHFDAAAKVGSDFKQAQMHRNKALLHNSAANTMADRMKRITAGPVGAPAVPGTPSSPKIHTSVHRPYIQVGNLKKAEIFDNVATDEDSNTLMNRTEDKYFISRAGLDYVTQVIRENLKEGDIDTEVRYNTNRSIYLDNPDLDSLKDSLNGVKPRMKIRVRQYSPNSEGWEKVAYVEIKAKEESGESRKLRVRIHADHVDSFTEGAPLEMNEDLVNINKDISKKVLEDRVRLINHLVSLYSYRKQIEVRYERRAYTNKDVRITIDEGLRFLNPKDISTDAMIAIKTTEGWVNIWELDHKLKNEGFLILEVKFQGDMPKWVKKALENAQARKVSFSKYASAMACVVEAKAHEGYVASQSIFREDPAMQKALDAGSALCAPSQLTGGAVLSKERVQGGTITTKGKVKSKWLTRAEEEYQKWTKREEYEKFMSQRMPHLTKGEIRAIGQVMALNKSLNLEKALTDLSGFGLQDLEIFKKIK